MADLGVCEWFHFGDRDRLRSAAAGMRAAGVRRVRTGLSWADYHREGGRDWLGEVFAALGDFEVLPCLYNTPPSLSVTGRVSGPPRDSDDFAAFVWTACREFGGHFGAIELWNEPNNAHYWDFPAADPEWKRFSRMIDSAAWTARDQGKRAVLGGLAPADPAFLRLLGDRGALEHVDVVGVHGFPAMWGDGFAPAGGTGGVSGVAGGWDEPWRWRGWADRVASMSQAAGGREVWVTETGLSTWDPAARRPGRFELQSRMLHRAAAAPAARVYWYGWQDLSPERSAVEGFHVDEHEYHFGLVDAGGAEKPALQTLKRLLPNQRPRGQASGPSREVEDRR